MEAMRLQKYMASAGIASRRACETLIEEGSVTINGKTARLGDKVEAGDLVEYQGKQVLPEEKKVYYLLFKPVGYVTTAKDEQGRKTVLDLVDTPYRVYPVGRLDINTSGLLLLTNDGELANGLTHPRFEVDKTYQAVVDGVVTKEQIEQLTKGVELMDGKTAPALVNVLKQEDGITILQMTIHEGRNRQVRRMIEAVGHKVNNLRRIRLGKLTLHGLEKGDARELTEEEIAYLYSLIHSY